MNQNPKRENKNNTDSKLIYQIIALILLFTAIPIFVYTSHFGKITSFSDDTQDWAAFITYSTSVAGLVVGVASTYLIYITYKSSVENSKETAKLAEESINNARLQQFESAFFQLLQIQQQVTNLLQREGKNGKSFIYIQTDIFRDSYQKIGFDKMNITKELLIKLFNKRIDKTFNQYFRNLYNIIKYVNEAGLSFKEQKKYIDLVQAQLTDDELLILSINCMKEPGVAKFRPLLDEYQFLRNVRSIGFGFDELLKEHYPKTKFKYPQSLPHGN